MPDSIHPYVNGDVFAIPLLKGRFGIVVLARRGRGAHNGYAYILDMCLNKVPELSDLFNIDPSQRLFRAVIGTEGIVSGAWPYVGKLPNFNMALWTFPEFRDMSGMISQHSDIDFARSIRRRLPVGNEIEGLEYYESWPVAAIERFLTFKFGILSEDEIDLIEWPQARPPAISEVNDEETPSSAVEAGSSAHLVRLHIPISQNRAMAQEEFDQCSQLEDLLVSEVERLGLGEVDGNEIGQGEYTVWLYGPDANRLADFVEASARSFGIPEGAKLFLRHGGVDDLTAKEEYRAIS